jgi:prevent-host-death family protein
MMADAIAWLDRVATGSYFPDMTTVSIKDAKNRLTELARAAEKGETITVTRNGEPVFDIVPHKKRGLDLAAGEKFLRERGVSQFFDYVAPDFDDPLPEDFLIMPLPAGKPAPRRRK